ncbi:phage integrase N-terminal domain-containing protein [Legionella israelensis]|uniref:Integrase n=1 Tax=Legionella israelensis TaxID=454 RepID=A0A0W0VHT3_9GAMM|nr:phage integrase N-terminal domain-containing protein [Legionella israelensis]KTD19421.1 hypothetical protein Lisr_1983 [Legionella israelensis]QBS10352.1 integrase [Legionella israelensis]SCY42873.1 Integrase [Legionella israelensis DSM 19235]STX59953.1 integrase [Legionella israelensis]
MSNKLRSAMFSVNEFVNQIDNYSHASLADMRHMLHRCMKDLHGLGYKIGHMNGLKPKHIHVLVEHWKTQGKNPATIKNYMAKLRKTANILGKSNLVKANNDRYNIPRRAYIPTYNKAIFNIDLNKCTDPHIRLSLEGQALFGLRREESMKLVVSEAWQGNALVIKPSWTKGGIGRTLPITNQAQQNWLYKVSKTIKPHHSLIPENRTYKSHLSHYQKQIELLGVNKLHGLRHAYAQNRYHELTAQLSPTKTPLLCPIQGGKSSKDLSSEEKIIDRTAREILSTLLGHSRISITRLYLG